MSIGGDISIDSSTPHLILCEGVDALYFLKCFLDGRKKSQQEFSLFRVYNFGGISELKKYLTSLAKLSEFEDVVRSITIIRDAENSASSACDSIKGALRSLRFAVPETPCLPARDMGSSYPDITTGFLLFPTCSASIKDGTLEDLCLNILKKEDASSILATVDKALAPYKENLPRLHKNKLHSFFSLTNEYVSLKIGEAARNKAFRDDSAEMESLKSFLIQMQQSS